MDEDDGTQNIIRLPCVVFCNNETGCLKIFLICLCICVSVIHHWDINPSDIISICLTHPHRGSGIKIISEMCRSGSSWWILGNWNAGLSCVLHRAQRLESLWSSMISRDSASDSKFKGSTFFLLTLLALFLQASPLSFRLLSSIFLLISFKRYSRSATFTWSMRRIMEFLVHRED